MKRHLAIGLLIGVLIGFGICYGYFLLRDLREESESWYHVQIGTFYYVWYNPIDVGADRPLNWECPKICDKPVLGYYNSCDPEIIKQHFTWLSHLRINFIVISWWGFNWISYPENPNWNAFINNATHQVFKTAKENITNVKVCIMAEAFNKTENPRYNYSEIYDYVYSNFVQPYPTVYYKYQGKPLICFFNDPYLTSNGNLPDDDKNHFTKIIVGGEKYANWIYHDLVKDWVTEPICRNRHIPVCPRFDDSRFRYPNYTIDIYLSERVYDKQWERAIELAKQSAIDVITICSWNEYPERTAIEPHWDADACNHDPYFLYNKTKTHISELKSR